MNRLVKVMLTSLATIFVGATITLVVVLYTTNDTNAGESESIDTIVEHSYESPEITTDLQDGSFVRIQFQILTDGEAAKEEISKRDFQISNILIKELAKMNKDDFKSGLAELEDVVKSKLNEVLIEGAVTDVYTINKILQ
ncbi:flagellar basal body-associated protein FliL [Virgibacillus sp. NKC19-16]|uniref:flagellar basal body-associated protein FliL n=1 Tax=Virgibacillus salidurans TaxID=2831673 RepID=UPI001F3D278C|nr:flagellar basal body-associated protein FliL [Virgibacillus sp. NKC19-16]UJL47945.1 flagellar basal body-associated protein FliL [Virgibacillus sp. NKC19-16]